MDAKVACKTRGGIRWWPHPNSPKCSPHRDDGPAVEYPDGHKEWWRCGEFLFSDEDGDFGVSALSHARYLVGREWPNE